MTKLMVHINVLQLQAHYLSQSTARLTKEWYQELYLLARG